MPTEQLTPLLVQAVAPTTRASAQRFTGEAWVETITDGAGPGSARLAKVWFAP